MANIIHRNEGGNTPSSPAGWDPFRAMRDFLGWDPFREMAAMPAWDERGFAPPFEVKETRDAYVFKADLPGVKESDIELTLTGNRLAVTGKREAEKKEERETYYAYERSYGSFARAFTLPDSADGEHLRAELKDGVLSIAVPKKPELKPKKIAIGSSDKVKA
jgi:HSP20 family protein